MKILVANIGSTSFKYQLLETETGAVLARGKVERIGQGAGAGCDYSSAIRQCLADMVGPGKPLQALAELDGIGFKAVHAGELSGTQIVTDEVLRAMEEFAFFAPAHNPPYVAAMRAFLEQVPGLPLVAVFETAFYDNLDEAATTYAVPYEWREKYGIRRYGFHGASHRAASERVRTLLGTEDLRHISCHLGGSSSIAAICHGVAVDTSFGMSPQSGLPQSNRVGDIDAFAVLYMMKKLGVGVDEMASLLGSEAGLAGISGISGDVRDLQEAAKTDSRRAQLAIDVFVHAARHYIGAFFAELGGLDVLTFSGGIGENSPDIRSAICARMSSLGIQLDEAQNRAEHPRTVSPPEAAVKVLVLPADEEMVVARATVVTLQRVQSGSRR